MPCCFYTFGSQIKIKRIAGYFIDCATDKLMLCWASRHYTVIRSIVRAEDKCPEYSGQKIRDPAEGSLNRKRMIMSILCIACFTSLLLLFNNGKESKFKGSWLFYINLPALRQILKKNNENTFAARYSYTYQKINYKIFRRKFSVSQWRYETTFNLCTEIYWDNLT